MKVLGISGRFRDAAAALAVDGQLIAAASEDCFTRVAGIGYTQTGGFPTGAVQACLQTAGLEFGDIEQLTVVEDEGVHGSWHLVAPDRRNQVQVSIPALHADAVHAAVSSESAEAVLVCSTDPPAMASFVRHGDRLEFDGRVPGSESLVSAARTVAGELGIADDDPVRGLDRLSIGGEPEFQDELAKLIRWDEANGSSAIHVDEPGIAALLDKIGAAQPSRLADAGSLNTRLQHDRRALAASVTCRLAHVVRDAAMSLCSHSHLDSVVFGGGMVANPRLTTELRRLVGDVGLAAVPEAAGRALGAALAASSLPGKPAAGTPHSLALGPAFADAEIKRTLDNCRLDYIYEPDWHRLIERVSKMLAQGKVLGWFEGPMGFGPRAMGTRSVLCDPSNRYARHNVNEYLRQVPLDEPLPVVFARSAVKDCLTVPICSALTVVDAEVKSEWRDRLTGALDWRHYVRVHAGPAVPAELGDLLETHYRRTGVPALIETNLNGPGEPTACTPRDAVKTVYSSAIDALVIGRFLLMKDYWLLKSHVD